MPGRARSRSPCTPQKKRLSKYKQLARDERAHAVETLPRHRYQVNPRGEKRPCRVVGPDVAGRTNCYSPKAHSARRKTCNLLVDPDSPLHDFEPGMYLVPGPRLRDETLVCQAMDFISYAPVDVDTRRAPPTEPIVALGPYVHPVTGLLTVKCVVLSAFEHAESVNNFGMQFQTMDMSERGTMVPDQEMLSDFLKELVDSGNSDLGTETTAKIIYNLTRVLTRIIRFETELERLDAACANDAAFQRHVRTICKCFYEMALYFRRYAGPGRKVPLGLFQGVGHASNPLSPALRGKSVTSTMTGVRLHGGRGPPADYVMEPEGTLTNMSQAYAQSILMIYEALPTHLQQLLTKAFNLGTPFRIVNGNGRFYLDTYDPNRWNGNPEAVRINLFDMCFGDRDSTRGFYAVSSVHGTRDYCVQVAAIQLIRTVQTVLPYVYRSRPAWALADGEFDNVHTPD